MTLFFIILYYTRLAERADLTWRRAGWGGLKNIGVVRLYSALSASLYYTSDTVLYYVSDTIL